MEEILTKHLSIFDGDDVEKVRMRKYLLHCDHNVSFHDFLSLVLGPLEFGVYYVYPQKGVRLQKGKHC